MESQKNPKLPVTNQLSFRNLFFVSPSVVLESRTRVLHHREAFVHRQAMLLDGSQTAARLTLHQLQHVGHLAKKNMPWKAW